MPARHDQRHRPRPLHIGARRRLATLTAVGALTAGCLSIAPVPARASSVVGPLMYVADIGDFALGDFRVYDTATGTMLTEIDEVAHLGPLALNPTGTKVYVSFGGGIEVFDTASETFGASIPESPTIEDVEFNPSGTQAYVTSSGSSAVSVIDASTETAVAAIPVTDSGGHIAFTPSGTRAYVTNQGDDTISVIDPSTETVTTTIPAGSGPTGVAVNPSGTLAYVADYGANAVSVIDTATDTIVGTIPVGANPFNIAFTPSGTRAYVTNQGDDTVSVIDTSTETVIATIPMHDSSVPTNIAFNAAGTLVYVTEPNTGYVSVIDTGTNQLVSTYGSPYPYQVALARTAQPTITTLLTSPGGTVPQGTPVTLTATVSPSTPGIVQFLDGGTALGAPVAVDVNTASFTTSALPPGAHSLTAVFSPSADTSIGSTSTATALHVNGPTLAIDQVVTKTGTGTVTTAPFSTTGPRLLVAFTSSDGPATKQTTTVTGAGLTWTLAQRANAKGGTAEIWTAQASGPLSGAAVTSTPKTAGYDQSLTVVAFSNASGIGAVASAGKSKGAPAVSLTTTTSGSWVFGVGEDYSNAIARTLGSGQNMVSQWVDTGPGETFWVQDETTAQPAGTIVTVNDTAPTTDIWELAAAEILPSAG